MDVNTEEVKQMFKLHENELVINLYVDHLDLIPPVHNPINNLGGGQENLGIRDN